MRKLLLALLLLLPLRLDAARLFVASNSDNMTITPFTAGDGFSSQWATTISASCWVYLNSLPGTNAGMIFVGDDTAGGNVRRLLFNLYNAGGTQWVGFSWHQQGGVLSDNYIVETLPTGVWTHIAATANLAPNPNVVKIYINGVSKTLGSASDNIGPPGSSAGGVARIGKYPYTGTPTWFLDGRLADLALWLETPTVLNDAEVLALSRGARPDHIRLVTDPSRYYELSGVFSTETDLGTGHYTVTTISGTSRANGPPVLPR